MKRFHPTRILLLRWFLTSLIGWIRPETMHLKTGCELWVPKKDRSIYIVELFLTGYYEKAETLRVLKLLSGGEVVVDVGANIGYYTCFMSKCVGNDGAVIAFEPVLDNRKILSVNVAKNGLSNVKIHSCALGEERRQGNISLSSNNRGAHSLVYVDDHYSTIEIEVVRFDEMVPLCDISFVKIDVEGFELSVLKGMEKHFRRKLIKNILIEFTPSKIVRNGQLPNEFFTLIEKYGFSGEIISNTVDVKDLTFSNVSKNLRTYTEDKHATFNIFLSLIHEHG